MTNTNTNTNTNTTAPTFADNIRELRSRVSGHSITLPFGQGGTQTLAVANVWVKTRTGEWFHSPTYKGDKISLEEALKRLKSQERLIALGRRRAAPKEEATPAKKAGASKELARARSAADLALRQGGQVVKRK